MGTPGLHVLARHLQAVGRVGVDHHAETLEGVRMVARRSAVLAGARLTKP
jgi:hypothetical protein